MAADEAAAAVAAIGASGDSEQAARGTGGREVRPTVLRLRFDSEADKNISTSLMSCLLLLLSVCS